MTAEASKAGDAEGGVLIAFDTSGETGFVAVGRAGSVTLTRRLETPSTHASGLLPQVSAILDQAGHQAQDLAGVVVGAGPGSFTGVRVAAATANGLCHALDIPLFPVSSLRAAGWGPGLDHEAGVFRTVLFDAKGDRVFAASYRITDARLVERRPPEATTTDGVLAWDEASRGLFMGSGARRHRDLFLGRGWRVMEAPWGEPSATNLLLEFWSRDEQPSAIPGRWRPDYLKGSSAQRPS